MMDAAEIARRYELDEDFDPYRFVPPGPVTRSYINDNSVMSKFIMGPVGGGKTVSCAFARIMAATWMPPCKDGVRRDRIAVVRSTFRDLEKSLLKSWMNWFPKGYPGSSWEGGNDRPVTHTLRFRLGNDDTRVEATTEFFGLNGATVEAAMRGREYSGAWVNEADTIDEGGLSYLEQRTGRYPAPHLMDDPDTRLRIVLGDFNAPDVDNWAYEQLYESPAAHRALYIQPSGRSADAENLPNLPPGYYQQMIDSEPDWYVKRFVDNEFGYSRDGKPVYEGFDQRRHVASQAIVPDPNLPLLIGLDAGLEPAGVLCQPHPSGQLRVVDELVPGHGVGAARFAAGLNELLSRRYPWAADIRLWADPSSQYGADKEAGELAWIETVGQTLGLPIYVTDTNEIGIRTGAVENELVRFIDGSTPRLLVSPHCKMIVRGFAHGYKFRKRTDRAAGEYDPVPLKNEYSHPHDALQYLVLGYRGRVGVVREGAGQRQRPAGWGKGKRSGRRGGFDPHKAGQ